MATSKKPRTAGETILSSWASCNNYLRDATEEQAKKLLLLEQSRGCRIQFLLRIHARYNKMRGQRERAGLLQGCK